MGVRIDTIALKMRVNAVIYSLTINAIWTLKNVRGFYEY